MTKCPKCGYELESVCWKQWICRNPKCKGWYCFYCESWHPYGTGCGRASLSGFEIESQEKYDKWCKNHREDIFKILKDSGYYSSCHDVDKYYPKDDPEVEE